MLLKDELLEEECDEEEELEKHFVVHCWKLSLQSPFTQDLIPWIVTQQNPEEEGEEEEELEKHFVVHCWKLSLQSPFSQDLIPWIVTQQNPVEELEEEELEEVEVEKLDEEEDEELDVQSPRVRHALSPGPSARTHDRRKHSVCMPHGI